MKLNNYESIINYLENQNGFTEQEIDSICTTILNINNNEQIKKITELFLEKIEKYLIENRNNYTDQELEKKINQVINRLSTSDITNSVLIEKKFTLDEALNRIKNSQIVEDKELEAKKNEEEQIIKIKDDISNLSELDANKISNIIKKLESLVFNSFDDYKNLNFLLQEKIDNLVNVIHSDKTTEEKNQISKDIINNAELAYKKVRDNINELTNDIKKDIINLSELDSDKISDITKNIENIAFVSNDNYYTLKLQLQEKVKKLVNEKHNDKTIEEKNEILKNIINDTNVLFTEKSAEENNEGINEGNNEEEIIEEKEIEIIKKIVANLPEKELQGELIDKQVELKEKEKILINRIKRNIPERFINSDNYLNEIDNDISLIENELKDIELDEYIFNDKISDKEKNEIKKELMEKITYLNEYKLTLEGRIKRASTEELDSLNDNLIKVKNELSKENKKLDKILFGKIDEHIDRKEKKDKLIKKLEELKYAKKEILESNDSLAKTKVNLAKVEKDLNDVMKKNSLNDVINTYYQIIEDTVNHFNDENKKSIDNIKEFVNNHQQLSILDKYENSEKLKIEILEEIKSKLNINNKIIKKENNKTKWLKVIGGIATGLSLGLAFSCVPNSHLILISYPLIKGGVKFIAKSINIHCQNNPEGKIARIKNNKIYKNITAEVNKLKEKLNESPLKYFINKYTKTGFLIGNIAGNLVESITGETVLEHAKDLFNNNSNNFSQITAGNITPGNITTDNVTPGNVTPDLLTNPQIDFSNLAGQEFDLSSIPQGFESSYSDTPVNLLTESAKNLSWDKANFVNGEEWWHFLKPDGQGYAWFKADDVRHIVEAGTKAAGKSL